SRGLCYSSLFVCLPRTISNLDLCRVTGRYAPEVRFGDIGSAHDMRDQSNHQLVPVALDTLAFEQPAEARNTGQSGDAGCGSGVGLLNDPANQVDLAFAQPDIGRFLILSNLR